MAVKALDKLPEPGSLHVVVCSHSEFAHSHLGAGATLTGLEMSEAAVVESNQTVKLVSVASVSCFSLGRHTLNVPELRFFGRLLQ